MRPYVSLWVFIGFYAFLCVLMSRNRILCIFMGPYGSLFVLMRLYESL